MIVRKMKLEDIEKVCEIENILFSSPWKSHDFESSSVDNNNIYLVVVEHDEIIAYCGLWGVAGEGQINNVAVKKEYQNKKIGFLMISELIERGKGKNLTAFTLEVRVSNERAIRLYHRLGFKDAGIRKNFYDKPKEDALIMWLHM
ncbi:ribosomal protein S18-alanine N-acetyltransferase [Anaeromicropila herbilytica]|uniref:[Ribosomal protein bS18]-alanine N-acetyltransferase n=1 Tax=Anaeromicropila herbilytica TaxID=2785025 RepID=A0A7R7EIZ9_9FIRM|nr:ribosomal protein S18-alanine N-acetyltransferase [Anaeromicropila herbilytica]BCN29667.1 ribosomal-protein-alanine acetyltransferase [Anaeromicropila herbilytica]